jgi:hypothetical protein
VDSEKISVSNLPTVVDTYAEPQLESSEVCSTNNSVGKPDGQGRTILPDPHPNLQVILSLNERFVLYSNEFFFCKTLSFLSNSTLTDTRYVFILGITVFRRMMN